MVQILKKNSVRIFLILLAIAIVFLIAVPIYQRATRKTMRFYENALLDTANFETTCRDADLIVRCKASQVGEAFEHSSGGIYTPVTFEIYKTYKGDSSVQTVTLYEEYALYKNTEMLYYPKESTPFPIRKGDEFILFFQTTGYFTKDSARLSHYGGYSTVNGDTVTLNPYIREVESLPGIGDDLTMPLSEFEALIVDNL